VSGLDAVLTLQQLNIFCCRLFNDASLDRIIRPLRVAQHDQTISLVDDHKDHWAAAEIPVTR
jgi:hypothetical protein